MFKTPLALTLVLCCTIPSFAAEVTMSIVADRTLAQPINSDRGGHPELFAGPGTLVRGPQNCILVFDADDGRSFVLDDYGDFTWGDRVYVTGVIDPLSLPCWPSTRSLIARNAIAEYFEGPGTIERGPQNCIVQFHADDGRTLILENYGDFFWGDRVYVVGVVDPEAIDCWPDILPKVIDNYIYEYFEGCGVLARGPQNCILMFHADDGRAFALDDYGDFFWSDRVYVTGPITIESLACWPALTDAIEHNAIDACVE